MAPGIIYSPIHRTNVLAPLLVLVVLLAGGCTGLPQGITPVTGFDADRYLGRWYEIARLDHSFERGLERVTAEYTRRDDGGLQVVNRGYAPSDERWKQAEGKAYFVGDSNTGHLKESFFGPFYGSYVVFELDREDYQYAFVAGYNRSYLWLLSRTPVASDAVVERFLHSASERGFDTNELIFVKHQ